MTRLLNPDREGGARNGDRHVGKGTASPPNSRAPSSRRENGCGNDVLWKPQNGFHRTWKSRTEREIPTFPRAGHRRWLKKEKKKNRKTVRPVVTSTGRW